MQHDQKITRRQMLKLGGAALAAIPVLAFTSGTAAAATNAAMRASMKYQDKPNGEKSCASCLQYVPGKDAASGGCKLFAGDTEVAATGFCNAWAAAPKK
ncbi:MAG TPA: high-potential iron-sulfur protein [Gallionella sp.]|nr:high-potential iron-sulfur protein [Gallionella sp.]